MANNKEDDFDDFLDQNLDGEEDAEDLEKILNEVEEHNNALEELGKSQIAVSQADKNAEEMVVMDLWSAEEEVAATQAEVDADQKLLSLVKRKKKKRRLSHVVQPTSETNDTLAPPEQQQAPPAKIVVEQQPDPLTEFLEVHFASLVGSVMSKFSKLVTAPNPNELMDRQQQATQGPNQANFTALKPSLQRKIILVDCTVDNVCQALETVISKKKSVVKKHKKLQQMFLDKEAEAGALTSKVQQLEQQLELVAKQRDDYKRRLMHYEPHLAQEVEQEGLSSFASNLAKSLIGSWGQQQQVGETPQEKPAATTAPTQQQPVAAPTTTTTTESPATKSEKKPQQKLQPQQQPAAQPQEASIASAWTESIASWWSKK